MRKPRLGVDIESRLSMLLAQRIERAFGEWRRVAYRTHLDATRVEEREGAASVALDPKADLVHEAVVAATEAEQVRELRLPTSGPWHDVMPVHVPVRASREATEAVAEPERAAKPAGNRPPAPPDVEDVSAGILDDPHEGRVARQAIDGGAGKRGAVVERAPLGSIGIGERVGFDMDHDLDGRSGVGVALR